MRRLIYTSHATISVEDAELQAIVRQSCENNALAGVTGMLWSDGSNFAQVLEGDHATVEQTMSRISADVRHRDIQVVFDRAVSQRIFGNWSMAIPDSDPESVANTAFLIGIGLTDDTEAAGRLYDVVMASAE